MKNKIANTLFFFLFFILGISFNYFIVCPLVFSQEQMIIHDEKKSYYFQDTKRRNFIRDEEIDTEKLKKDGFLETREGTRIRRMYNNQYYIEERYDDEYRKHKSKRPD